MATHRTDAASCPWCGHYCDAATNAERTDAKPEAGSLTVCIECYGVGEFFTMKDGRMNIKPVNQNELDPGDRAVIESTRLRLIYAKRNCKP